MKVVLEIELEVDENMWCDMDNPDQKKWFEEEILDAGVLSLHSNEIGDTVGQIKSCQIKTIERC